MAYHDWEVVERSGEWVKYLCQNDGCSVARMMWRGQEPHEDERCEAASEPSPIDTEAN